MLPREVVESLSLEVFKNPLDLRTWFNGINDGGAELTAGLDDLNVFSTPKNSICV